MESKETDRKPVASDGDGLPPQAFGQRQLNDDRSGRRLGRRKGTTAERYHHTQYTSFHYTSLTFLLERRHGQRSGTVRYSFCAEIII